jgi:hypothetical protein
MIGVLVKGEAPMNQAVRLPRVSPWIVVALAVALVLLVATALVLVVEPGILRAIGTALHGPQHLAGPCPGAVPSC